MLIVTSVEYEGGYCLRLGFSDGACGGVDLEPLLWGPVFEPLRDVAVFSRVRLSKEFGTIVWENGADVAPEWLRERLETKAKVAETPERYG
jgi:hypothetical protein